MAFLIDCFEPMLDLDIDYNFFKMNQDRLLELTTISGGHAFLIHSSDGARLAFEAIAQEQRVHYSIGFTTTNPTGKSAWHRLKIKVAPPANFPNELKPLAARSRKGTLPALKFINELVDIKDIGE